ncbi:MAG: hypothetical protein ACRDT0_18685 [Pseudonocardiaceae bacterium]
MEHEDNQTDQDNPNAKPVSGDGTGPRAVASAVIHTDQILRVVQRKVTVKGSGGVTATVVVVAQRGKVWMSIQPPFTWEAIMEPGKVDELIRTLGLAGEDAKRMGSGTSVSGGGRQPVGNGTVAAETRAHEATGTKSVQS